MFGVPPGHACRVAGVGELGPSVVPGGVEQRVAHAIRGHCRQGHGFVDQGCRRGGQVRGRQGLVGQQRLQTGDAYVALEDGQREQQGSLGGGERLVAPIQQGPHGLMTGESRSSPGGHQAELGVEQAGQFGELDGHQMAGGEFDGQGDAVQSRADAHHMGDIRVPQREAAKGGCRPVHEQLNGGKVEGLFGGQVLYVGSQKRRKADALLAGGAENLPAGGQDDDIGRFGENLLRESGGGLHHAVAAIENQQDALRLEPCDQGRGRITGEVGLADGQRHRFGGGIVLFQQAEIHPIDIVRIRGAENIGDTCRNRGLADAARANQRDQPAMGQALGEGGYDLVPPYGTTGGQRDPIDREEGLARLLGVTDAV